MNARVRSAGGWSWPTARRWVRSASGWSWPKNGKNIDFAVARGELTFYFEVKAPYVPQLTNRGSADDSKVLRGRVEAAGEQFKKGRCNVLLLVPVLRISIHSLREQLIKAVLGEHALRISVSLDPGVKAPPPEVVFKQDGKLTRLHPQADGSVTTDLTRISAVVSLEHVFGHNDRDERGPFLRFSTGFSPTKKESGRTIFVRPAAGRGVSNWGSPRPGRGLSCRGWSRNASRTGEGR